MSLPNAPATRNIDRRKAICQFARSSYGSRREFASARVPRPLPVSN